MNQLTELDVSGCTSLTLIACYDNQLTELDLSHNFALQNVYLGSQSVKGLKVKHTSRGFEVNLKDYVSKIENIVYDSLNTENNVRGYIDFYDISGDIVGNRSVSMTSYDVSNGIAIFEEQPTSVWYYYNTHCPTSVHYMSVRIYGDETASPHPADMKVEALERSSAGSIISGITENSYLNNSGNQLIESDMYNYSYSSYGKKGIVADGNSRLILRVQTTKPGTVSFSGYNDIGAKLESLSRNELTASDQLNTTQIVDSDTHQVSAVLVAPERFPEDKSFPSDTFKVHVKFTDEDGEITEDDLELKLEAAPVILIPGMLNMVGASFFLNPREAEHNFGDADHTFGVSNNSGIWRELSEIGFKKEHIALFDYNSWTSVKNNVNALFDCLKNMFDTYDKEGIVCTKADVVAHGLGGLLVRQYLDESGKGSSSSNNNNWSEISYKQGMIHKVVNIAVPHRGTPLANVMLGDMSVINNDLPLGIDRLAYRVIKYFPSMIIPTFNGASKETWNDLAVGSDVTNLPFPVDVPMHFIYGDVTYSLNKLEEIKDIAFLLQGLLSLGRTLLKLPGRVNELGKAGAPLQKVFDRAILEKGIMDETTFEKSSKLLDRNNLLRFQEFMKAVLKVAQNGMSAAEMAKISPTVTGLMQIGGVAIGGVAGLLKTPIDLFFVIPRLIFSGQAHDKFVPVNSAIAAFPEYSTGFPETPDLWDVVGFEYSTLCQQYSVAEFVGYLLKVAPMSEFVVLRESVPLPGSTALPATVKADSTEASNADIEIDFDNFYVKNFSLTIIESTHEDFGDGMTALKFIANASIKTSNDVKLVVQKDSFDRIFPMFTEDGNKFESILVFSSSDEGAMTAYCYAPSDKGNLYISDTVDIDISAITYTEDETAIVIDEKTFPDENFRAFIKEMFDSDNDGKLTLNFIEGVTAIDCSGRGIKSLKGIELFTGLVYLTCTNNELTELDLSRNVNIYGVACQNNKLERINLANCSKLFQIWLDNNNLTSVDFTDCPELNILSCKGNKITSLDLSKCGNISELDCDEGVEVLYGDDIPGNSGLVIEAKNFPDETFRNYVADNFDWDKNGRLSASEVAGIRAIDVTGMGISTLKGIEHFPSLEYLSCSSNDLTELDISENVKMKGIACDNNRLETIDLTHSPELVQVWFSYNKIASVDLTENPELKILYLLGNMLTELDISGNPNLEEIGVHENKLTSLDVSSLAKLRELHCGDNLLETLTLGDKPALLRLYCYRNDLTELNLIGCPALKELSFGGNKISAIDITHCKELESLAFWDNFVTELDISAHVKLKDCIFGNNRVKTLNVGSKPELLRLHCYSNDLSDVDVTGCPALMDFSCEGNKIRVIDVTKCKELEVLYCRDNPLKVLDLSECPKITNLTVDEGVKLIYKHEETAPEILTEILSNAVTNQAYNLQLQAYGATPITWTCTGKLPAGLMMSESGLISGTPKKAGKLTFTVTAKNDYGKSSQKFTLQVFDPVSIITSSLKAGTIGKSYSVTMRAKGTKTIKWSAEGLPNGLSMNEKGRISGKPTVYGVFNVKVKAENGAGITEKTLQLTVKAIAPKLSGSLAKPTLNQPYSSSLKVTGSTPITWSIEGNLPEGLTLDTSTGIISGTPTSYAKSGYKITLTATNGDCTQNCVLMEQIACNY